MKLVNAPTEGVFRIARADRPVFSPPEWSEAGRSRFDDPVRHSGARDSSNFQTVYCATTLTGSFVETLQGIRPLLTSIAELDSGVMISDRSERTIHVDLHGSVPVTWRLRRSWGQAKVVTSGRFVDVAAAESLASVRTVPSIANLAVKLGLEDIDISAMTGPKRDLTQAIARYIHDLVPDCSGLRYISRFGTEVDYECWAVFEDRARFEVVRSNESIFPTTPGFSEAMKTLHLVAELV